jgi:hypothetical protein
VDAEYAMEVLLAADLFILPELKTLMESQIARVLTEENVTSILQVAHRIHSATLVSKCFEFIESKKDLALIPGFEDPELNEKVGRIIQHRKKTL